MFQKMVPSNKNLRNGNLLKIDKRSMATSTPTERNENNVNQQILAA